MGKKHKQHKRHSASGGAPASPHVETPGSAPPASLPVSISLHSRGKQPPPKPPREPRPHAAKPHPLAVKPLRIPMQSIHFEEAAAVKPLVISSSGRQLKANDRDIPVEFKIVIPRAFYERAVLAKQRAEFGRLEGEGSVRGGGGEEEGRREHRSHKHKKHQKRRHGEDSEPIVLAPQGAPSAPSPLPPPLPHSSVHATPSHPPTLPPPTVTHAAPHDHKHKKHKHKKHRTHAHSTEQAPLEHCSHSTEQAPLEHRSHSTEQAPLEHRSHSTEQAPFEHRSHSTEQAPLKPHRVHPHPIKQAPLGPTDYGFPEPRPPLSEAPPHSSSLHASLSSGSHKQAKKKKKKHKHSHEPILPPLTLHTSPLTPSPTLRTLTSHGHGHPPSKHRRDDQPPLPKQPRLDLPKATPPQIHSTPSEPPLRRHSDRESEGGKRWREGSHKQDKRGGEEGGGERWAVVGEIRRDEAKTRRETPQRPLTKPARAASNSSLSPTSSLTLHPSHSPASPLTPLPSHSPRQPLTSHPTAKPLTPHPSHSPAPPLTPHPSPSSTQPLTPLPSHSPRHPLPSRSSNAAKGGVVRTSVGAKSLPSKESGLVEGTEGMALAIPSPPLPSHPLTPLKSSQLKLISKVTLRNFLKHLHSQISKRDGEGVFGEAVTDDIAPNYSKIISQPMDLSLMRSKVESHQYPSVNEFRMDFELMCGNAMTYNAPETLYYASAKKLLGAGLKIISKETAVRPDIRYGTIGPAPSRSDTASPQPQPPPPLPPPPPEFHLPPPTSSVLLDYSSPFLIRIDVAPLILHSTKPPPPPPHLHTVTESPLVVADERMEVAGGVEGVKSGAVEVEVPDQSFLTRVVVGVESEEEEGEGCGGEGVLVEARAAAEAAKENLDANQPDSHAAFLKRDRETQRTLLSFINPDSGEVGSSLPVDLTSLSEKVRLGTNAAQVLRSELPMTKATPVSYLMYGPFGSFAPVYDSAFATLSKMDSDLLLSTYGSNVGVSYAHSMQQFVQGAGSYVSEMADAVLNGLTNGRHGKFTETCRAVQLTEKEKRKEEEEEEEEEGGEGEGDGDGGGEEAGEDKPFRALAVKEEDEAMEVQLEGESASPLMKQSAVGVSAGVRAAAILSPLAELDSHVPAGRETPFLALPDVEALSGGAVMRHGLLDDGGVASGSASPVAVSNLQSSVSGSGSGSKVTSRESSVASGRGEVGGGGGGGGEEGWETRLDRAPESDGGNKLSEAEAPNPLLHTSLLLSSLDRFQRERLTEPPTTDSRGHLTLATPTRAEKETASQLHSELAALTKLASPQELVSVQGLHKAMGRPLQSSDKETLMQGDVSEMREEGVAPFGGPPQC